MRKNTFFSKKETRHSTRRLKQSRFKSLLNFKATMRIITLLLGIAMCFSMTACSILDLQGDKAVKLSAPTNIRINDGVLSWNFVENAIGYTVKIIGKENADIENEEGHGDNYRYCRHRAKSDQA